MLQSSLAFLGDLNGMEWMVILLVLVLLPTWRWWLPPLDKDLRELGRRLLDLTKRL